MTNTEQKIEEILKKYTSSPLAFDDNKERVVFQEIYFPISSLTNEILTLIQESKKEAVETYITMLLERIVSPPDCDAIKNTWKQFEREHLC